MPHQHHKVTPNVKQDLYSIKSFIQTKLNSSLPSSGFAESWKWCQVADEHSAHAASRQTPAMHVNSGPVILIRAFTGQIHQLQFQISATELSVDMSSTTFLNSFCLLC